MGKVCSNSVCATSCGAGLTDCTGTCRDLTTDSRTLLTGAYLEDWVPHARSRVRATTYEGYAGIVLAARELEAIA